MEQKIDFTKWELELGKLNSFFLSVGEVEDYTLFSARILEELGKLISFDQGVAVYYNAAGKMVDCYLSGVDKKWGYIYKEYYAKYQSKYPLGMKKSSRKQDFKLPVQPITWATLPENEFIKECIGARGVKHSLDFCLFDHRDQKRLAMAMDRTRPEPYAQRDVDILNFLLPHLENMHRKFFLSSSPDLKISHHREALLEMGGLTKREKEVVSCLCDGIPPASLCEVMNISRATVNRHIANIYKKMDVNNLQELLVHFL